MGATPFGRYPLVALRGDTGAVWRATTPTSTAAQRPPSRHADRDDSRQQTHFVSAPVSARW